MSRLATRVRSAEKRVGGVNPLERYSLADIRDFLDLLFTEKVRRSGRLDQIQLIAETITDMEVATLTQRYALAIIEDDEVAGNRATADLKRLCADLSTSDQPHDVAAKSSEESFAEFLERYGLPNHQEDE